MSTIMDSAFSMPWCMRSGTMATDTRAQVTIDEKNSSDKQEGAQKRERGKQHHAHSAENTQETLNTHGGGGFLRQSMIKPSPNAHVPFSSAFRMNSTSARRAGSSAAVLSSSRTHVVSAACASEAGGLLPAAACTAATSHSRHTHGHIPHSRMHVGRRDAVEAPHAWDNMWAVAATLSVIKANGSGAGVSSPTTPRSKR